MAPMSNFWYPLGRSNNLASCGPSLKLVNSNVVPSLPTLLIGMCVFWSIQAVRLFLGLVEVNSHLSQERPLTVSVPTFLQVISFSDAQGLSLMALISGICGPRWRPPG